MKSFFNVGLSAALLPPHLAPVGHHSPPVWFPWHRERTERGMSLLTRLQVHPSVHTHARTHARKHTHTEARTGAGNKGLSHSQSTFPQSCNKSRATTLSLLKPASITLYATCARVYSAAESSVAVKPIHLNGFFFATAKDHTVHKGLSVNLGNLNATEGKQLNFSLVLCAYCWGLFFFACIPKCMCVVSWSDCSEICSALRNRNVHQFTNTVGIVCSNGRGWAGSVSTRTFLRGCDFFFFFVGKGGCL